MNNRPLKLGLAEITFRHEYSAAVMENKKNGIKRMVGVPRATHATINTGSETVSAMVKCSKKDRFTYEIGRKLAMKKAFAMLKHFSKEERKKVWEEYNSLKTGGRW